MDRLPRKLANLFLILFFAAALSGLGAAVVRLYGGWSVFADMHPVLQTACLLSGVLVYLGFGFNRHLPLRLFLPLFAWLLWDLARWWPLTSFTGTAGELLLAIAPLLLGVIVLKRNAGSNGGSLLLVPDQFAGPAFSLARLLRFTLTSLLVLPVLTLLILFSLAGNLLDSSSGGFVQLKADGLYMTEKVYQRQEKQIRLAAMIHLAQPDYYEDLLATIPTRRTLILAEGVSDELGLMERGFSYDGVARALGLSAQETFPFAGRWITRAQLERPVAEASNGPDILAADVDLQQFDPRTVAVLNALARYVLRGDSLLEGYLAFNRWAQEQMTAATQQVMMTDLIDKRDRALVALFPPALKHYDILVVPWGALHMKGIEAAVLEQGFTLRDSRQRRSISFSRLPYDKLWSYLRGSD
ncbi:MAG: hypothetical protein R6W66_10590 [Pelovirga sp.]